MFALFFLVISGFLCAYCVWKALQQPKVLSIIAVEPGSTKDRR